MCSLSHWCVQSQSCSECWFSISFFSATELNQFLRDESDQSQSWNTVLTVILLHLFLKVTSLNLYMRMCIECMGLRLKIKVICKIELGGIPVFICITILTQCWYWLSCVLAHNWYTGCYNLINDHMLVDCVPYCAFKLAWK